MTSPARHRGELPPFPASGPTELRLQRWGFHLVAILIALAGVAYAAYSTASIWFTDHQTVLAFLSVDSTTATFVPDKPVGFHPFGIGWALMKPLSVVQAITVIAGSLSLLVGCVLAWRGAVRFYPQLVGGDPFSVRATEALSVLGTGLTLLYAGAFTHTLVALWNLNGGLLWAGTGRYDLNFAFFMFVLTYPAITGLVATYINAGRSRAQESEGLV